MRNAWDVYGKKAELNMCSMNDISNSAAFATDACVVLSSFSLNSISHIFLSLSSIPASVPSLVL